MPRIILDYEGKRWAIWCKKVPPTVGGKKGTLITSNVERKQGKYYEYISFPRLIQSKDEKLDDILINLLSDPEKTGKIELPYDGEGIEKEVTIKLKWKPENDEKTLYNPLCKNCLEMDKYVWLRWIGQKGYFLCENCKAIYVLSYEGKEE